MAQFPALKTGAVAQYPAAYSLTLRTDVVRFFDGSEQRFRNSPQVLHRWVIALDQLDEQEMAALEEFFLENEGGAGYFAFTDPWTGLVYPLCSIDSDRLTESFSGPLRVSTSITIRENYLV